MPTPNVANIASAVLEPWPIPKDQIVAGSPSASGAVLHTGERDTGCGLWECTPGSFTWQYDVNQSMCVIEGEAQIEIEGGERFTVRAGDAAFFPAGTSALWTVRATVRKLYTLYIDPPEAKPARKPAPKPAGKSVREPARPAAGRVTKKSRERRSPPRR